MQKIALFYLFCSAPLLLGAQQIPAELKSVLDSAFTLSEQRYFYTNEVNWPDLKNQVYKLASGAKTKNDLMLPFQVLINGMRDSHGSILDARTYNKVVMFNDWANDRRADHDQRPRAPELFQVVNKANDHFEYTVLSGNIGYLKIPGYMATVDINKEALTIRTAIEELAGKNVEHWIIDLRFNGGGNMNPMLAGLAPLLANEDGPVSSFVYPDGSLFGVNELKNGQFYAFGQQVGEGLPVVKFKKQPQIAVLTSMFTVSSGEIVAASFKKRPQTRFFGEATGGLITSVGWLPLSPDFFLSISEAVYADRKGERYLHNIPVDQIIPFTGTTDQSQDKGIEAAIKWLTQ